MDNITSLPVSCNKDCGAGCALTAYKSENEIIRISDSPLRDPYMKGCLKGYRSAETVYHEDRLKVPLIRTGKRGSGNFREASWDEALDLISEKMLLLKRESGCQTLMRLGGSGSCRWSLHNTDLVTRRFLSLYGNYTETAGSYSSEASSFVKKPVFGTKYVGIDAETLLHSRNIVLWGFNPFDTRFDCKIESVLREASRQGIPMTVIDPRKTRTVKSLKAHWIPLKPGTDFSFMLAILYTLIDRDLINRQYLETYSHGFSELEEYIIGKKDGVAKSPQWASDRCGISADTIISFAMDYSESPRTALLPGLSLQRALGGENVDRLGAVLQLATGNTGQLGGSTGCSKWNRLEKPLLGKLPVPINKNIQEVPVYLWADAVIEGKKGGYPSDINFLYNVGGNYIGQGSDRAKTIKAFEKAEFSVTHDYFLTETAAYSDVVLPVTTFLEREDLVNTTNNYIFYSAKVIEPVGQSKNDFAIFSLLADRLGFGDQYSEQKSDEQWIDDFLKQSEISDIETFKTRGFYSGKNHLRVGLSQFINDPEKHPLKTDSGKIEISSQKFVQLGGTRLPEPLSMNLDQEYPLRMISPHEKYRIHSQNDNIPSFKKLCDDRLWINREDAESRNITNGDMVEIVSAQGRLKVESFVTDKISSGSVSLNQGSWKLNVNHLTSTIPTMPSRGSRTHSIAVNIMNTK